MIWYDIYKLNIPTTLLFLRECLGTTASSTWYIIYHIYICSQFDLYGDDVDALCDGDDDGDNVDDGRWCLTIRRTIMMMLMKMIPLVLEGHDDGGNVDICLTWIVLKGRMDELLLEWVRVPGLVWDFLTCSWWSIWSKYWQLISSKQWWSIWSKYWRLISSKQWCWFLPIGGVAHFKSLAQKILNSKSPANNLLILKSCTTPLNKITSKENCSPLV